MKMLRKIAAVFTAAAIAAGSIALNIGTYAAGDLFALSVKTDKTAAKVGDTVTASVIIDAPAAGIGALEYKFHFDMEAYTYKSEKHFTTTVSNDILMVNKKTAASGIITLAFAGMQDEDDPSIVSVKGKNFSIMTVELEVVKPNGKIWLEDLLVGEMGEGNNDITAQGTITDEITVACDHAWNEGTVATAATCTAKGVKTVTCKNGCGETKTEEIAALGHDWDEGTATTAATCIEKGVKTVTCKNGCGETKTEEIAALGHNWDEGKVTKEPTKDTKGEKSFTCTVCKETKTEEISWNSCTDIELNQATAIVKKGASVTLTATVEPTDTDEKVEWISSDEKIATVKDGVVTAVARGKATITAKCGEKESACAVEVISDETTIVPLNGKPLDLPQSDSVNGKYTKRIVVAISAEQVEEAKSVSIIVTDDKTGKQQMLKVTNCYKKIIYKSTNGSTDVLSATDGYLIPVCVTEIPDGETVTVTMSIEKK